MFTALVNLELLELILSMKYNASYLLIQAKRAGSKLSSRVVPVDIIMKWHDKINEMESSVRAVIKEERYLCFMDVC